MSHDVLWWLSIVALTAAASLIAHILIFRLVGRLGRGSNITQGVLDRGKSPARAVVGALALYVSSFGAPIDVGIRGALRHGAALVLIASVAWLVVRIGDVLMSAALEKQTIDVIDNLKARKVRTQLLVLQRLMVVVVSILAIAAMLTTFSEAKTVGASILASAGIAGLVAGVAARPTIGNLIAGMQIAFSEPIRIDDVVVVEGEWGRIEEITLTYVTVRIWDDRRLVLPVSYFIEHPFENWTRSTSQLLGTVYLYADHTVPVDDVRRELTRLVESNPLWDGRVALVQVTDTTERAIVMRALISAPNSSDMWDLRCDVREGLVTFLRERHPESLPRLRAELDRERLLETV